MKRSFFRVLGASCLGVCLTGFAAHAVAETGCELGDRLGFPQLNCHLKNIAQIRADIQGGLISESSVTNEIKLRVRNDFSAFSYNEKELVEIAKELQSGNEFSFKENGHILCSVWTLGEEFRQLSP